MTEQQMQQLSHDVAAKYGIDDFDIQNFYLRVKVRKSSLYKLSRSEKSYWFYKPKTTTEFFLVPKNNTLPKIKIKGGDFKRLLKLGMAT